MSHSPINPYQAPSAPVQDVRDSGAALLFAAPARRVDAGNGASWISEGWALFKAAPLLWIVTMLVLFGISLVLGFIPLLGNILSVLLGPVFMVGVLAFAKGVADSGEADIGNLFVGLKDRLGALMTVAVLYFLMFLGVLVIAGVLAFLLIGSGALASLANPEQFAEALFAGAAGLGLLVALLVFFALMMLVAAAYWYAPGLVFFAGLGAGEALRESFAACLRNWLPFLVYGVLGFFVLMAGALLLGLGLLVAVPVLMASYYTSFRDLFGQQA